MLIRPIKTMKISENVYAVRSGISNFYIIGTGGEYIAFDTGMNTALSLHGMKRLGISPEKVTHVFLTHSDYDHVGGLSLFRNAEVYISIKEEPMVTGQKARLLFKYNKRLKNYKTLEDGETISAGDKTVRIILAPGHTAGSACYMVDDMILISGDVLRTSKSGRVTPFLFFQNMNHSDDKKSLEKLRIEGILDRSRLILTGHTGILEN